GDDRLDLLALLGGEVESLRRALEQAGGGVATGSSGPPGGGERQRGAAEEDDRQQGLGPGAHGGSPVVTVALVVEAAAVTRGRSSRRDGRPGPAVTRSAGVTGCACRSSVSPEEP